MTWLWLSLSTNEGELPSEFAEMGGELGAERTFVNHER
jgi:hypothetical protein